MTIKLLCKFNYRFEKDMENLAKVNKVNPGKFYGF